MGVIGQNIKDNMAGAAYLRYLEYVAYLDSEGITVTPDSNMGSPTVNPYVDIRFTNAIGDAVEEFIGGPRREIVTPIWDVIPLLTTITELETNVFKPTITLNWEPTPDLDAWVLTTTYDENDEIAYSGNDYISLQGTNLNHLPDEGDSLWWAILDDTALETRVFRKKDSGVYIHVASIVGPGEEFIDEDVSFNVTYYYKLIRFDPNFDYSQFSTEENITTDSYPVPISPVTAPTLTVAANAIGIELETVPNTSAEINHYVLEYQMADAQTSGDGFYSIPLYPDWSAWTVLLNTKSNLVIHNEATFDKVYKYQYKTVSNYSVDSVSYSPESIAVIPFPITDIESTSLSYYADIYHSIMTGSSTDYRQIVYSPFSLDPDQDSDITGLVNLDLWFQTSTGIIWEYVFATGHWDSTPTPELNIDTPTVYNAYIDSTIEIATKTDNILPNYKKIVFRKVTIERFASKIISDLQNDASYQAFIDSYIKLLDTYYNSLYGLLINMAADTTNHNITYVEDTYLNLYNAEIDFLSYIYTQYISNKSNSNVNDFYTFSFDLKIDDVRFLLYIKDYTDIHIYYGDTTYKSTIESTAIQYDLYFDTTALTISAKSASVWVDITSTSGIDLLYLVPSSSNGNKKVTYFNSFASKPNGYSTNDLLISDVDVLITGGIYTKTFTSYTLYTALLNQASGFEIEEWTKLKEKVSDTSTKRLQTISHTLENNYEIGDIICPVSNIDYSGIHSSVTFEQDKIYFCINDYLTEFNPAHWANLLKANDSLTSNVISATIAVVNNSGDTLTPLEKVQVHQDWINILATYDDLTTQTAEWSSNFSYVDDSLEILTDTRNELYEFLFNEEGVLTDLTTTSIRTGLYDTLTYLISNFNLAKDVQITNIETARTQYESVSGFIGDDTTGIDGVTTITNVPSQVSNVVVTPGLNSLVITWDNQGDLTNLKHYEIQASDISPSYVWHSLLIEDSTNFQDANINWTGIADTSSKVVDNTITLENIPGWEGSGGYSIPVEGRTVYFRIRIITKLNTEGTWSSTENGKSEITRVDDVSFNVIRALAIDGDYAVTDVLEIDGIPVEALTNGLWADSFQSYAKTESGTPIVQYKIVDVTDDASNVVYQVYEAGTTSAHFVLGRWIQEVGFSPQSYTSTQSGDAQAGGYLLSIGDNAGNNDDSTLVWKKSIPYDPEKLYRIRARVRKVSGTSNLLSIGVIGRNGADDAYIDQTGGSSVANAYYVAIKDESPSDNAWYEYIGYVGADYDVTVSTAPVIVSGIDGSPDNVAHPLPSDPGKLYTNESDIVTKYFRPLLKFNSGTTQGKYDIDYLQIEEINPKTAYQLDIWSYTDRPFEIDGGFVSGKMVSQFNPDYNFWNLELGNFSVGLDSDSYFKVINVIDAPDHPAEGLFIKGLEIELTSAALKTFFTVTTTRDYALSHNTNGLYWGVESTVSPSSYDKAIFWDIAVNDGLTIVSNQDIRFEIGDSSSSTLAMIIDSSNNNVGIGNSPVAWADLHIYNITEANLYVHTENVTGNVLSKLLFKVDTIDGNARFKGGMIFERHASDTHGVGALHLVVDTVQDDGNAIVTDAKLTITRDGDVGIDTIEPDEKLDVRGDIQFGDGADAVMRFNDTTNSIDFEVL